MTQEEYRSICREVKELTPHAYPMIGGDGKPSKNQFQIITSAATVFQSYDSVCAVYYPDIKQLFIGDYWNYDETTREYLSLFVFDHCMDLAFKIGGHAKGFEGNMRAAIDCGEVIYVEGLK